MYHTKEVNTMNSKATMIFTDYADIAKKSFSVTFQRESQKLKQTENFWCSFQITKSSEKPSSHEKLKISAC